MTDLLRRLTRRLSRRARAFTDARTIDQEHDDEVRFHLEMETNELRRDGIPTGEAQRRALASFGGVAQTREAHRDARGVAALEEVARDVRYAVRSLRRAPAFTLSAVLVLALGIGACTVAFSAIDAVLLRKLPYPHDDRLVRVYLGNYATNRFGLSVADFRAIEEQNRSLAEFGVAQRREVGISFGAAPERAGTGFVTAGFLRALGVRATRGRLIEASDEPLGAQPVTVVGHALATRAFGSDERAIGRSISIDGKPYTVVGVLPPDTRDLAGFRAQLWASLQLRPPERRGPFGILAIGRLKDGVTLEASRSDLSAVSKNAYVQWKTSYQDSTARYLAIPLREAIIGNSARTLTMFAVAVGLVLLIAIANVASLSLVRATGRWREMVLRTTLGATRTRLARLLVSESLVLALAGAALGLVLGAFGLRVLLLVGPEIPRLYAAHLDVRAGLFAASLALVAGVVVGAYPVTRLLRGDASRALRDGSRTSSASAGTQRLRGVFVVAQFALALPLLAGAGLLLNSFLRLQRVRPGFETAHLLTVRVSLPAARYPSDSTIRAFWTRAIARVGEVPGVISAGLNTALPPNDDNVCCNNFDLVDHPVAPGGSQPMSPWMVVTPDYFAMLGARLDEGRLFTPADTGVAPVIIVSRAWAKHYFPEGNVVGRQLISGGCTTCPRTTVVGVVGDVKYIGLDGISDAVYSPIAEAWSFSRSIILFARTRSDPRDAVAGVQGVLRSLDPELPLDDSATMDERLYDSVSQPRQTTSLVSGFAAAALALAAVGIFGMLSYTVNARRREIGVRMALGARRGAVTAMVVRGGMRYALTGAALGLAITAVGARRLSGTLYEVGATDPATLIAVTAVLLLVALVASWLPARRAARIHPMEAIRAE